VIPAIYYALLCAAASLLVAWSLIRRRKTGLGLLLGLAPIALMEALLHGSLQIQIHRCLEEACLVRGLPANCDYMEFGCTEWGGLATFMYWAAGLAALVVYAIGAVILTVAAGRRLSETSI
jgi:hypothetical protein